MTVYYTIPQLLTSEAAFLVSLLVSLLFKIHIYLGKLGSDSLDQRAQGSWAVTAYTRAQGKLGCDSLDQRAGQYKENSTGDIAQGI